MQVLQGQGLTQGQDVLDFILQLQNGPVPTKTGKTLSTYTNQKVLSERTAVTCSW
jgi:hypothetical protein